MGNSTRSRVHMFLAAALAAIILPVSAHAGGAGGLIYGTSLPLTLFGGNHQADYDTVPMGWIGGEGYWADGTSLWGGFGLSLGSTMETAHGGFGGFVAGKMLRLGDLDIALMSRLGLGGGDYRALSSVNGFAGLAQGEVQLGILAAPWCRMALGAGLTAVGALLPASPRSEAWFWLPHGSLTISFGSWD